MKLLTGKSTAVLGFNIVKIMFNEVYYLGNLLAACTIMRISEVLAVLDETLMNEYIFVDKQEYGKVY